MGIVRKTPDRIINYARREIAELNGQIEIREDNIDECKKAISTYSQKLARETAELQRLTKELAEMEEFMNGCNNVQAV